MTLNLKFLRLPGSYNFKSNISQPLHIKKIQFHLGPTFYTRMSNIYTNTIQAIANQNYSYLSSTMSPSLSNYLITKRNDLKQKGYRVRVHRPNKTVIPSKNTRRDRTWNSQNIAISIQSNVYFGMQFDPSNPLNQGKNIKVYRTGVHRFWAFDRDVSVFQNISNFLKYQTYQFRTKIISSTHMKVFDNANKSIYLDDQKDEFEEKGIENAEKEVETQFLMRTGNSKFDWVIIDINGTMVNRSKA